MNILFVTSECAPFSKSGGLADVAFSLPPALKQAGDNIEIIVPYYKMTRDRFEDEITFVKKCSCQLGERTIEYGLCRGQLHGVTVWFIEHEHFFHRPRLYGYGDDSLRFAFFSRVVVDLIGQLTFVPDILHCNDWETALSIIYLKNDAVLRDELKPIKSVYTIHNIAYQGQFGSSELTGTFGLPWGWYDGGLGYEFEGRKDINLMKGAMLMADAVSTVSPTYARELHYPTYGMGLQGVVDMVNHKLYGILNGIDVRHYDPSIDPLIPYKFDSRDRYGKTLCKREIQRIFGLNEEPEWPLLTSVARLNEQKGIELIKQILPQLMEMGVQLIVFGQGDQKYIDYFNWAKQNWPGQLGFSSDYNEPMASKIFAGADMYLMPSRFEPCGLSQMMAMRYGTVPIVHETGGLKDSVRAYKDFDGIGDGFAFSDYQARTSTWPSRKRLSSTSPTRRCSASCKSAAWRRISPGTRAPRRISPCIPTSAAAPAWASISPSRMRSISSSTATSKTPSRIRSAIRTSSTPAITASSRLRSSAAAPASSTSSIRTAS